MKTAIYRLEPAAPQNDPAWDIAPCQGVVVVRAKSAGDARVVASLAEADFRDISAKPSHGVSTRFASAFNSEKLYHVTRDTSGRYEDEGDRCLLEGAVDPDVVRPFLNEE